MTPHQHFKLTGCGLPSALLGATFLCVFVGCRSQVDDARASTSALEGQPRYTTTCEIRDGVAYGSVNNSGSSFTIDGDVLFSFFNSDGRFLGRESDHEYEFVSTHSVEEIDHVRAPSNAVSCGFDVANAIVGATPQPPASYATRCEIRDGRGYGSVNNFGPAFTIDGALDFQFFNSSGRLLTEETEYEYEYVSSHSTEEIDFTRAPSNATSCAFSIARAIRP